MLNPLTTTRCEEYVLTNQPYLDRGRIVTACWNRKRNEGYLVSIIISIRKVMDGGAQLFVSSPTYLSPVDEMFAPPIGQEYHDTPCKSTLSLTAKPQFCVKLAPQRGAVH